MPDSTPLHDRGPGPTRFVLRSPDDTNLHFENELRPENVLPYVYNGAGLAAGDVDGDGLPDLYLVSQDGPNKLFRQVAPFRFEDVTEKAGVDGGDAWGTACSITDVDGDGHLDIYVSNTESPNLLYINRGDGTFDERAAEFGLDHVGASTMPAFADYDNDGDMDLYLATNRVFAPTVWQPLLNSVKLPSAIKKTVADMAPEITPDTVKITRDDHGQPIVPKGLEDHLIALQGRLFFGGQADRLYRNDGGKFVDVTEQAGIHDHSMGLSVTWWDYDDDGWLDLYVANDLESPDALYHNKGDGTFELVTSKALPHLPYFGMGSDAGDIDQDGRFDLIVADMAMRTHYDAKMIMGDMGDRAWFLENADPPQIMRNALYMNTGTGRFMEAGYLTHTAKTDWTWVVKFGDLDGDGWLDLFATNGIPRFDNDPDLNPRFRELWRKGRLKEALELARNVPAVPEQNVALRNEGTTPGTPPDFEDVSTKWGFDAKTLSHGAVFVDLDRDGDLDVVINDMNGPARVYENQTGEDHHQVLVRLVGRGRNPWGIGTRLTAYAGNLRLERLLTRTGGYYSTDEPLVHLGLGANRKIDRLIARWPSGAVQEYDDLPADRLYRLPEPAAPKTRAKAPPKPVPTFVDAADTLGLKFTHVDPPFDDFAAQPLVPERHSRLGPGFAVGDVDGDGRDDLWIGGATGHAGTLFVDGPDGFVTKDGPWTADAACEDLGVLLFDADGDGDLDLYVASGSDECPPGDDRLRDRLYLNDGKAGFTRAPADALPDVADSSGPVAAADFDHDGDLDLFVGGRIVPGRYPEPAASRLLRNDGGNFTDVTEDAAPDLLKAGLVSAAMFTDADDDGLPDLLIAGHWMPLRLFHNQGDGHFDERTDAAGFGTRKGWWNGLAEGDVDGDGDLDYVATNRGLNSKYKASDEHPARIFAKDFDGNGVLDVVEAKYQGDRLLPVRGRSCSSRAMPFVAQRFPTYDSYARASLGDIYTLDQLDAAREYSVNELSHVAWLRQADGTFVATALPRLAQISPGFGVAVQDLDGDGRSDVVLAQNFYWPEPETGRMAGGVGLWMRGTPKGLVPVPPIESGIVVPEDARGLAIVDPDDDGRPDLAIATNGGPLRILANHGAGRFVTVRLHANGANPTAIGARLSLRLADGTSQVAEVQAGSSYLTQQSGVRFGLGDAHEPATLTIRWPDGDTESLPVDRPVEIVLRH